MSDQPKQTSEDRREQAAQKRNAYTDPPYRADFWLVSPEHVRVHHTVADESVQTGMDKMNVVIKTLLAGGWVIDGADPDANAVQKQVCDGFMLVKKGSKVTVELPFTLNNGEPSDFPKVLSAGHAIELFMKSLADSGIDTDALEHGDLYDVKIEATWKKGKEIKDNPGKFYNDWISFKVLDDGKPAAPPPPPKPKSAGLPKRGQPEPTSQTEDESIPF